MTHSHHGTHHHDAHGHGATTRMFAAATLLNLAYTALEAGYGFLTNSLALLSDALHNLGDVLGLGLAWTAAALARRAPTARHTYGWRRATLLSPLANALLLIGFSGALLWEAVRRFGDPPNIPAMPVIVVAAIGIGINLLSAWWLHGGHAHDLNKRGAYLHLLADAAVSLAAVVAGIGMLTLGWWWLDPLTGLLVGLVIAVGTWGLLRDSFDAAMDAVPAHIDQAAVAGFLARQPGVTAIHHLHIWPLGAGQVALTAHLVRPEGEDDDAFIDATARVLDREFGIDHATLQIERSADCGHGEHGAGPHQH
ncbi:MAG: cation diffusion facilitator family transporter [Pseudoxanthomonas sp.]